MNLIQQINAFFEKTSLPGEAAQFRMAHHIRHKAYPVPKDARIACVLLLLYQKNEEWYLVLIERVSGPHDKHSGQMSFPGGAVEKEDKTLQDTALREAHEEIGADPDKIQVLGQLTDLYIPVSNFLVHPFVAYSEEKLSFQAELSEVKTIVEIPFRHLIDPSTKQKKEIPFKNGMVLKNVPYFNLKGKVVWGATAMILNEFLALIEMENISINS